VTQQHHVDQQSLGLASATLARSLHAEMLALTAGLHHSTLCTHIELLPAHPWEQDGPGKKVFKQITNF
jgi:hypothetical protein